MGEDWNEEEDGVGAHMKRERGESHCADIMLERQASRRWKPNGEKVEQREEKCSFWRSSKTPDIYLVFLCSAETIQ